MKPDSVRFTTRLALAALCALAAAPLQASEQLTICYENKTVAPWRLPDTTGLNFDILNSVATRLALSIKYEALPWKRCLARLGTNEVDGAFSVSYTDDRRQYGAYPGGAAPDASKRLHDSRYVLVRRKGSKIDWDGHAFKQVDGAVAFQLGYSVGELLRKHELQVSETADSLNVVARRVISGSLAGAALYDSDAALLMASGSASRLDMLPIPLLEKPYFLMLSHALVKTKPELAARIWQAIEDARNSPDYIKKARAAGVAP